MNISIIREICKKIILYSLTEPSWKEGRPVALSSTMGITQFLEYSSKSE